MKRVDICIDTSLKGPARGAGACLYILSYEAPGGLTADAGGIIREEDATENRLTILGLNAALSRLKASCRLILYLECPYAAAVLRNGWLQDWRGGGWLTAKGKPVRDAALWQQTEALLSAHAFEVLLKQEHPYRDWMRGELRRMRA